MPTFDPYNALIPVFLESRIPKRLQQFGSAVFKELHGEPFLFTAAHVTDESRDGDLLVPTRDGLSAIDGYMAHIDLPPEIPRSDDTVDIAYYRLSSSFANALCYRFAPVPTGRSELIESAVDLGVCSVVGYPASKGKKKDGRFTSAHYAFRGVAASMEYYDRYALTPDTSIIIHFSKKRAVHPGTYDRFPVPSLRGISGGGIFVWPRGAELSNDWSLPKLVGIVHTYKEREGLVIGSTLLPILAAITLGQMKGFGGVR